MTLLLIPAIGLCICAILVIVALFSQKPPIEYHPLVNADWDENSYI